MGFNVALGYHRFDVQRVELSWGRMVGTAATHSGACRLSKKALTVGVVRVELEFGKRACV